MLGRPGIASPREDKCKCIVPAPAPLSLPLGACPHHCYAPMQHKSAETMGHAIPVKLQCGHISLTVCYSLGRAPVWSYLSNCMLLLGSGSSRAPV
jgi:hypothetical protein